MIMVLARWKISHAITLVELMVAAALTALIVTLAFGYLLPATRAASRVRLRGQLQQTAAVALNQITEAASKTSPGGFSWSIDGTVTGVAFNPLDDIQAANAAQRWSPSFTLFWWNATEAALRSKVWPPGSPVPTADEVSVTRAKRLWPSRLDEVALAPEPSRVLARGVTGFKVKKQGGEGELIQPISIDLTLAEEVDGKPVDGGLQVSQRIVFRVENQL